MVDEGKPGPLRPDAQPRPRPLKVFKHVVVPPTLKTWSSSRTSGGGQNYDCEAEITHSQVQKRVR